MNNLEDIFRACGTDKVDMHHYAQHYERHLGHLRISEMHLLEIGVGHGQSLAAWDIYFQSAKVFGLDVEPKDLRNVYLGNQGDPRVIAELMKNHPAGFEVIIDDGSHSSEDVIKTLLMLWPLVTPNGVYVIEDLQTAYWPSFAGSPWPNQMTSMSFLKGLVDGLNWEEKEQPFYNPTLFDRTLLGISFYHNIAFLQKGNNMEGSNLMHRNCCPWSKPI